MKKIPLTQGKFALVDDEDYEWLMKWKWFARKDERNFYAARNQSKKNGETKNKKSRRLVSMHKVILKPRWNKLTDHIDGDGLNNQRDNLRSVTYSQNAMNRRKRKKTASSFKGVFSVSGYKGKKWIAKIRINQKLKYLGISSSEVFCARLYNEAAIKNFGEYARPNEI